MLAKMVYDIWRIFGILADEYITKSLRQVLANMEYDNLRIKEKTATRETPRYQSICAEETHEYLYPWLAWHGTNIKFSTPPETSADKLPVQLLRIRFILHLTSPKPMLLANHWKMKRGEFMFKNHTEPRYNIRSTYA
jgi:hypothetical protein